MASGAKNASFLKMLLDDLVYTISSAGSCVTRVQRYNRFGGSGLAFWSGMDVQKCSKRKKNKAWANR